MIEQIKERVEKLDNVGQQAFDGTDYSFGFNAWRSGTITLLRRLIPKENYLIEQLENINLKRVDIEETGANAYNLEACKGEAREILEILIKSLELGQESQQKKEENDFWQLLHPRVIKLAKTRFENGLYADSVSACLREINTIMKNHVRNVTNQELDGAALMTRALSANNPIIEFGDITTENGRNIQIGYMKIFEGAMIGIRNPKAHENMYPDLNKAIHMLFIASFMFIKLQETGLLNEE